MIHGHAVRRLVVLLLEAHGVRGRRGLDLLLALLVQSRLAAAKPQRILGESKPADAETGGGERVAPRGAVRAPGVVVVLLVLVVVVVRVTVARNHAADAELPEGHADADGIVPHGVAVRTCPRRPRSPLSYGCRCAARFRPPSLRGAPLALATSQRWRSVTSGHAVRAASTDAVVHHGWCRERRHRGLGAAPRGRLARDRARGS